jgi:hypothetical protein
LTDAIQGLAWGSLAIYGAQARGMAPNGLTWMIAAYATVFIMFINGIHGSLRDLANDVACGARTTAIFLGARPPPADGAADVPVQVAVYASSILAVLVAMNAALMLRDAFDYGPLAWSVTAVVVGALNVFAVLLQPKVLRPRGPAADSAWRLQMYVILLSLPTGFLARTSVEVLSVLALLNATALVLWDCTAVVARSGCLMIRTGCRSVRWASFHRSSASGLDRHLVSHGHVSTSAAEDSTPR